MKQCSCTMWAPLRLLAFGLIVLMSGCVTVTATSQRMVPDNYETELKYPYSVSVVATGVQEKSPGGNLQISDAALTQALTESITKSKLFSRVVEGNGGEYRLTVAIVSLEQALSKFPTFLVNIESGWILKRADTGVVVWQGSVRSSHTASIRDAIEGSMKNNIQQGLGKISHLKL